jgi:hypothetical protein
MDIDISLLWCDIDILWRQDSFTVQVREKFFSGNRGERDFRSDDIVS